MTYETPLFGLYGACSTCGLSLSLGSMVVSAGFADYVIGVTSSHYASAEKDSMNMGACMAPAAADTICQHMKDFSVDPKEYDKIITGDLGTVGQTALIDLLMQKGIDISDRHMDCGLEIFNQEEQDTHAGGSGCGCSAVVLSAYLLKKIEEGVLNKILFVPTGALLSKTSFNEGKTVPGIAHAIVIEKVS